MDAGTVYEHPVTHSTAIIMINQAIKIDIMTNILVCPMQCQVHGTVVNKCPKFLPPLPSQDNHTLLVHDPDGCSSPLTIQLSLDGITSYFKAQCPSLLKYEEKTIPKYPPLPCTHLRSQEDGMVDHRGHLIAKCSMDPHIPDMTVSLVVSVTYMAIAMSDDDIFAAVLDQHKSQHDFCSADSPSYHSWKCHWHVNDMSTTDQVFIKFSWHCNLLWCQFLEIPCK